MPRFNTRAVASKIVQPIVHNFAGGEAYGESSRLELVSILLTSLLGESFYEKSSDTQERTRRVIADLVANGDGLFAAKAAV